MKAIIYSMPDGHMEVCRPALGARLASAVFISGERHALDKPQRIDQVFRVWPVDGVTAEWAETEDEFVARIRARDIPKDATGVQDIEASAIPADRTFRDAWKSGAGRVEHDMAKCRALHRERIRQERRQKLATLDATWMKCIATGDTVGAAAAEAQRQQLRDATSLPEIDSATTPEALKAVWPNILK